MPDEPTKMTPQERHELWDAGLAHARKTSPFTVTCRGKGCCACCSEPVIVEEDEMEAIVKVIPAEEVAGVIERTIQWAQTAVKSRVLDEKSPHVIRYKRLNMVCPLLKNGACLVYADRPMACRAHNVIGNPDDCFTEKGRRHQKFEYAPELIELSLQVALARNGSIHFNHLGAWLVRMLLGKNIKTAVEHKVVVADEPAPVTP